MTSYQRLIRWCQQPSMIKVYGFQPTNFMVAILSFSIILSSSIFAYTWYLTNSEYIPNEMYVRRDERVLHHTINDGRVNYEYSIGYSLSIPWSKLPFIIEDQVQTGLNLIEESGGSNPSVSYDPQTGKITIKVKKFQKYQRWVTLWFENEINSKFEKEPIVSVSPSNISFGEELDLLIEISSYVIGDLENIRGVQMEVLFSDWADSRYLNSSPEGFTRLATQEDRVQWSVYDPPNEIESHSVSFHVNVRSGDGGGWMLFRNVVILGYEKPFLLRTDEPTFNRAGVIYTDQGSKYESRYTHMISEPS